ncbi:MAG: hypothetical protein CSA15_01485 [Candidatus Delongbacteria bacterium]|nr:MAG: hypothetical protein CSA15_01485 [Candidatus Delongbacteria bacterium]
MMKSPINEKILISKDDILSQYSSMNKYFIKCIRALYGESIDDVKLDKFNPSKIINDNGNNNLSSLDILKDRTGVYIFVNNEKVPVYIGVGGKKVEGQDLKTRIGQELREYRASEEDTGTTSSKEIKNIELQPNNEEIDFDESTEKVKSVKKGDTGATLSKNIQDIECLLMNKEITPNESIKKIKSFNLITISIGSIVDKEDVKKARVLETILISLFNPKYNK